MTDQTKERADDLVRLDECPVGLFWHGDTLAMKSEYGDNEGRLDCYIVSSGEYFCGPSPQTIANQRACMVRPVTEAELSVLSAPTQPAASREDVARIIDPLAFETLRELCARKGKDWDKRPVEVQAEYDPDGPIPDREDSRQRALTKADRIAALFPTTQAKPADVEGA